MVETKAPTYYIADATEYAVSIRQDGQTVTLHTADEETITNASQKGSIEITKSVEQDDLIHTDLSGFAFRITGTAYTGEIYDQTFTTDENGKILVENLRVGEYTISEIQNPDVNYAFILPQDQKIEVTYNQITNVTMENTLRRGTVTITKHDASDSSILVAGATMRLEKKVYYIDSDTIPSDAEKDEKGYYYWFTVGEETTDQTGQLQFSGLVVGDYRITETKAPDGYQLLAAPVTFSLPFVDDGEFDWNPVLDVEFSFEDLPVYRVPASGGLGTWPFYIAGLLIAGLGVVLIRNRKSKSLS